MTLLRPEAYVVDAYDVALGRGRGPAAGDAGRA